jgi:hypothetical protein
MVNGDGLTLVVPDLSGRLAVVTGANSPVPGAHFDAAVEKSRLSIPHVSKELICKYLTDLKLIGALEK